MKKEIAEEWVAALRSGDYQQGQRSLRTHDAKFCCLGVLCDLARSAGIGSWSGCNYVVNTEDPHSGLARQSDCNYLPPAVVEWAGANSSTPRLAEPPDDISFDPDGFLANMNDAGASFTDIANLIEKHWSEL